jgi:hypothetical protein
MAKYIRCSFLVLDLKGYMVTKAIKIFESHSRLDKRTCDRFETLVAVREGVKVFRSEYEKIKTPAWQTIKKEMELSKALFLLVGPELVKAQEQGDNKDWKYTQNWIAYEVGLACALNIDVWVLCDNVKINFPVPYLNNYTTSPLTERATGFKRYVLRKYIRGGTFPFGYKKDKEYYCPHKGCGAKFNFHTMIDAGKTSTCPTCLQTLKFPHGWRK